MYKEGYKCMMYVYTFVFLFWLFKEIGKAVHVGWVFVVVYVVIVVSGTSLGVWYAGGVDCWGVIFSFDYLKWNR